MREQELERMVVRLQGDASHYQRMLTQMQAATRRAAERIASIGRRLTTAITLPLAAIGGVGVAAFSSFDDAMTKSTSIMSVTEDQIARMRNTALSLSTQSAHAPAALAEAYYFLASAGLDAEQSMRALPQVMSFATAGAFDLAQATDLLTDAQSALGLTVRDNAEANARNMGRVSDVLVRANTLANASVQQFSEALTNEAGAALRAFNIDLEQGVAVLAAYADQGTKGNVAGSSLSRVIRLLSQSARDNGNQMFQVGNQTKRLRDIVFDAEGGMRNFADIIQDLEQILGPMSTEMRGATLESMGFQARVQQAILPLIGTSDVIRQYERNLREAAGTTGRVANNQMKSFASQMRMVKNQITVAAIEIGKVLAPTIGAIAKAIGNAAKWLNNLDASTKKTIVTVALLVAAAGPLLWIFSKLLLMFGPLAKSVLFLSKAFTTLRGATIAASVGIGVLVAVGIARLITRSNSARESVRKLNEEMERSNRISQQWNQRLDRRTESTLERARGMTDRGARRSFLQSELQRAQRERDDAVTTAARAQRQFDRETSGFWFGAQSVVGGWFGQDLEGAHRLAAGVDEAAARLESARRQVERLQAAINELGTEEEATARQQQQLISGVTELESALRDNIATFGMSQTQIEIWRLSQRGANDEQLRNVRLLNQQLESMQAVQEATERGRQITEQYMTDQERANRDIEELNRLLRAGHINQQTYDRGMESISNGLDRASRSAQSFSRSMHQAASGSAEAIARIQEWTDSLRAADDQQRRSATTSATTAAATAPRISETDRAAGVAEINRRFEQLWRDDANRAAGVADINRRFQGLWDEAARPATSQRTSAADRAAGVADINRRFQGLWQDDDNRRRRIEEINRRFERHNTPSVLTPDIRNIRDSNSNNSQVVANLREVIDVLREIRDRPQIELEGADLA